MRRRGGRERWRYLSTHSRTHNLDLRGEPELRPTGLLFLPPQQENFAAFSLETQQMIENDGWRDGLLTRESPDLRSAALQLWENSALSAEPSPTQQNRPLRNRTVPNVTEPSPMQQTRSPMFLDHPEKKCPVIWISPF